MTALNETFRQLLVYVGNSFGRDSREANQVREAQAEVETLIRRDEIRSLELAHLRLTRDRLVGVLVSIHARCAPADVKLPDGRVTCFVPPDPALYWRELSDAVKRIEAEVRSINDEHDAAIARATFEKAPK